MLANSDFTDFPDFVCVCVCVAVQPCLTLRHEFNPQRGASRVVTHTTYATMQLADHKTYSPQRGNKPQTGER